MHQSGAARLAPSVASCTLHVCTSCRPSGSPREPRAIRPGFRLFEELRDVLARSSSFIEVQPAECLSICPRPCGLALSAPGSWTYLFGDQQPGLSAHDIVACISLYLRSPDGFMPRADRPPGLRASILGRVPPYPGTPSCT